MSATVPAVIVTSVMPHPPVSGGHKRTLRLVEAIARSGAIPHLVTVDSGQPGAADELRARGWHVDVPVEAPPTLRPRRGRARGGRAAPPPPPARPALRG